MNAELIRIVDGIARDKGIEKENVFVDIEQAIAAGLRRQYQVEDAAEFQVSITRDGGAIKVFREGQHLPLESMGRIGAQTVKQVMIQLLRQDERGSIYDEFKDRVGTIISGTVVRFEGPTMIVSLGRVEGIMPRGEQIPGEYHNEADRVQALIVEVRDTPSSVKNHPQPQPPRADPPVVRAGGAGGGRAHHRDQGPGPRAGRADEAGGAERRRQGRRRGRVRRRPRQPDQKYRGGARRREDRHRPVERVVADPDRQRPQAGGGCGGQFVLRAGPGDGRGE